MLEIVGETLGVGTVIAGSYRLERVVGEGGMGVVWEAYEIATQRRVALKFLREKRQSDTRNQERILREARATMAIRHPNIAEIYAVLETDAGVPFLVMELLEGITLRTHLTGQGVLNPVECARILRPVIAAVQAAHERHIVHRDLKPENIFLLRHPDRQVRVLDFGIAKQLLHADATTLEGSAAQSPSLTSTGAVIGTPVYMAPEQIFGDDDIDGRADVWSLGIILYECLAGRRPTDGEGFGRIIRRITTDPIEPLARVRPELPQSLTKLVATMLLRDRAARASLSDVETVLSRIEARGADAPPSERLPPSTPSTPRRSHRSQRRLLITLGGTLTVVALLGGAVVATQRITATHASIVTAPDAMPDDATKLFAAAQQAFSRRDGASCLRALDRYDASSWGVDSLGSASPGKGFLNLRATCMMLAGDCEGGKVAYRKSFLQSDWVGFDVLDVDLMDNVVESAVSTYCEGDKLSARDELLRANQRLTIAGLGQRPTTPAECNEWHATELRLVPVVKPRNDNDVNYQITSQRIEERAAQCLAHAGDCATSFRLFRDNYLKAPAGIQTQDEREAEMLVMYETVASGTSCSKRAPSDH